MFDLSCCLSLALSSSVPSARPKEPSVDFWAPLGMQEMRALADAARYPEDIVYLYFYVFVFVL